METAVSARRRDRGVDGDARLPSRKADGHHGALARLAFHTNGAPVGARELTDHGESDATTSDPSRRGTAPEAVENSLPLFGGDADPRVSNRQVDELGVLLDAD